MQIRLDKAVTIFRCAGKLSRAGQVVVHPDERSAIFRVLEAGEGGVAALFAQSRGLDPGGALEVTAAVLHAEVLVRSEIDSPLALFAFNGVVNLL